MPASNPPPNVSSAALPPLIANPIAPRDTTSSMKCADRLTSSKEADSLHPDDDIGAVEMYKTSVVLPFPLPNEIVPFWAVNLMAALNNLQASVNNLQASLNNLQATLHNIGLGQMQQIAFVPQMGNKLLSTAAAPDLPPLLQGALVQDRYPQLAEGLESLKIE